jgi:hypothetical protein
MRKGIALPWLVLAVMVIGAGALLSLKFIEKSETGDECLDGSCDVTERNNVTEKMNPDKVVEAFYSWVTQYEGNVMVSGAYKTSEYLSDTFKEEINTLLGSMDKGGFDPFICAQDVPERFVVGSPSISNGIATVRVEQVFQTGKRVLPVELRNEAGLWKISAIKCQNVELQAGLPENLKATLYFSNERRKPAGETDCAVTYGVERAIPANADPVRVKLELLFGGPSASERSLGYSSMFSDQTKGILNRVKVINKVAYVDIKDIRSIIPNASSSCGSAALLAQIEETLKHNRDIDKVIVAINGNPETFYDWLQLGCSSDNNDCDTSPFNKW